MKIQYFNRQNNTVEEEKVYGVEAVKWLYKSSLGRALSDTIARSPISQIYGDMQSSSYSKRKIQPFIKKFDIKMEDFVPGKGKSESDPYDSFNDFFIREFKEGIRNFDQEKSIMPAFCEARYMGVKSAQDSDTFPVKGSFLRSQDLVANEKWHNTFKNGPLMIARLCPVDYHRFHFPDDGKILDAYPVPGRLHSVNPIALKEKEDIFITNERFVTILETENFGKLAYIEVGATCVGKIVQSRPMHGSFKRGEEKGYFLFGGSTVVLVGEAGKWAPDDIVLEKTKMHQEVYQHLGTSLARAL